jgi:pyruvate kinase
MTHRKAKIICTEGPASSNKQVISALIKEGMDVARLNFSHGTHEQHIKVIKLIRDLKTQEIRCHTSGPSGTKDTRRNLKADKLS